MPSRGNKKKSGRRGSTQSNNDNSPANEIVSDASPSNQPGGDASPSEEAVREFAEDLAESASEVASISSNSNQMETDPARPAVSLYQDVVKSAEEPLSTETRDTADADAKSGMVESEPTLPATGVDVALVADDNSNFFKSFFSCCVGRK